MNTRGYYCLYPAPSLQYMRRNYEMLLNLNYQLHDLKRSTLRFIKADYEADLGIVIRSIGRYGARH